MTRRVEAIFENGVLRPLEPLTELRERARVQTSVEIPSTNGGPLGDCIGSLPEEDAAEMLRIIEEEFEQVDERDWS